MTHVIAEPCIDTKDTACVDVCPVDCIHEAADGSSPMLYIDPVECIDCAACVPACPVDAIFEESDLPSQWNKYTQINADFFAGGGAAAPAAAAAGGGAAAAPAKKAAPEPEPMPEPLELTVEEMYKELSEIREDVATNRGREEEGKPTKRSPTLIFLAAAVILLVVYGISNNFSKSVNTSLYGKLSAFALGDKKPTLSGSIYSINQTIGGKKYTLLVSDSIFGGRTLQLQAPAGPIQKIYHKDEKFFDNVSNQYSRYYYTFVDDKSDGTVDSILQVREIWSKENRFLGRYHNPIAPNPELQKSYQQAAKTLAKQFGIAGAESGA